MKLLFVFIATLIALGAGCSVDEFSNPQRKSVAECKKLHGESIMGKYFMGKYCDLTSNPDAGVDDAGSDAGEQPQPDSGASESCSGDATEACYDGDAKTRVQMPCHAGERKCVDGTWGPCKDQVTPAEETCNDTDDDCNGLVDDVHKACTVMSTSGACSVGMYLCQAGKELCAQTVFPSTDACNDKDDDCDGKVDENTDVTCYDDAAVGCTKPKTGPYECQGLCKPGVLACEAGKYSTECKGAVVPQSEDHCTLSGESEQDEDCDGEADEGCACAAGTACYSGAADTKDVGPCHGGTRKCVDATHRPCEGEVTPQAESCANSGVDNDCNGKLDDIPMLNTSCADDSQGTGACQSGALWKCDDDQLVCSDAIRGVERCDGQNVDEDCDGKVDEGFPLETDENNCGVCGRKCSSGLTCCGGECVSTTVSNANCGSCGTSCGGGACCNSACKNTNNDKNNCGTCGHICPTLLGLLGSCSGGTCQ